MMIRQSARVRLVLIAAAVLSATFPAQTPLHADDVLYTVSDLGAFACCDGWGASRALAINAHGDIAGEAASPDDPSRSIPFVYQHGTMTAISDHYGWATGINDSGQVTGFVVQPGQPSGHAFVYQDGVLTDLGAWPGFSNQPYSLGLAINNSGTIAGDSDAGAWIVSNGTMSFIKRRAARTAYGINDLGDIVGLLEPVAPTPVADHGFLFSGQSLIDIGTIDGDPGSVTVPQAVNLARQIAGYGWTQTSFDGQRAFLWENGAIRDLGTLNPPGYYGPHYAEAHGINNAGDVVGISDASGFLYRNGAMIDLNASIGRAPGAIWPRVWTAMAINDAGQIAGSCYFADGTPGAHACLLTPVGLTR
jgi:probable HAF family extracellular repeat protein